MTIYYSEDHEWLNVEGDIGILGITAHAAEQLGEVVFVEQKDVDDDFEQGDEIGVIESVKAASEIFAPVDCEVIEINEDLEGNPGKLNESPESDGWIYKLKISDPTQLENLMDEAAYKELIG
ncbi:MAG: glycine cleavage system protein GcvH [Rhodobacteraceae bacterium]|nr:glycine cleavage system protein GcvH [Paracoccaceae bacterium]